MLLETTGELMCFICALHLSNYISCLPRGNPELDNDGLFDPNSDVEAVEVKDDKQIYHNFFSFTNRLCVKATIMDPTILRQNLEA